MGQHESKPAFHRSTNSLRMSKSKRDSTLPRRNSTPSFKGFSTSKTLQYFSDMANYLLARVQNYEGGNGSDPQYQQLEQEIVSTSASLQEFRKSLKKDSERFSVDEIQKLMSGCLRMLIEKKQVVVVGEEAPKVEAAVEKVVLGSPLMRKKEAVRKERSYDVYFGKKKGRLRSVKQIERAVGELKEDAIEGIRNKDLKVLDELLEVVKKIGTDLEMVDVEKYSPLYERKEILYKTLVKINGNIKKTKRSINQVETSKPKSKTEKQMDDLEVNLSKLETHLSKLPKETITSNQENLKSDLRKILSQIPETAEAQTEQRKLLVMYKVNKLLESIEKTEVNSLITTLNALKYQIELFDDDQKSSEYFRLDQSLRKLWDQTGKLDEDVHVEKKRLISEIQNLIQVLGKKAQKSEDEGLMKILDAMVEQSVVSSEKLSKGRLSDEEMKKIKEKLGELKKCTDKMFNDVCKQENEISVRASQEPPTTSFEEALRRKKKELEENRSIVKPVEITPETKVATVVDGNVQTKMVNDFRERSGTLDDKPEKDMPNQFKLLGEQINSNTVYYNFTTKRRKSIENIELHLKEVENKIDEFSGTTKTDEYYTLENECLQYMNKLKRNKNSEITQKISETLHKLDSKLLQNQELTKRGRTEIKEVVERVANLKKRIDNFTGFYMNVLYQQIESSLRQEYRVISRIEVLDDVKLQQAVEQMKSKIEQYLKILEEKSQKPNSVEVTDFDLVLKPIVTEKSDSHVQMQQIESAFEEICKRIDTFSGIRTDKYYIYLEEMLIRLVIELDKIPVSDPDLKQKRRNLMQKIRSWTKVLDNKADAIEDVIFVEYESVRSVFENLSEDTDGNTYNVLLGKLSDLLQRFNKTHCEDEEKKRICITDINNMISVVLGELKRTQNPSKSIREVVV